MRAGQDRLRRWALPGHRVASLTPWTRVTAAWPERSRVAPALARCHEDTADLDGWLAEDAQVGEDVPADRATPVPPARGHPVVATPGSDSKQSAGRCCPILWR